MNKFTVNNIKIDKNKIFYDYTIEGEWVKYFNLDESFYVEYSEDVSGIPKSVAVVPLLVNILPVFWVFDGIIYLDEIDHDFQNSIPNIKKGYIDMYPEIDFNGDIAFNNIRASKPVDKDGKGLLFSGGADAFHSLITHLDEKPDLITILGADLDVNNHTGWELVKRHVLETGEFWNVNNHFIKSNFRLFINESVLNDSIRTKIDTNWWVGFQHGIALLGLVAPISTINNISLIYIASSYTDRDKAIKRIVSASDPTIDNFLKFNGTSNFHDGYDYTRLEKISMICEFGNEYNLNIPLRVCWESEDGSNCCKCEKCIRTIISILASGFNPNNYGFNYTNTEFTKIMKDFKYKIFVKQVFYIPIQQKLHEKYSKDEVMKELQWFYNVNVKYMNKNKEKYFYRIYRKVSKVFS